MLAPDPLLGRSRTPPRVAADGCRTLEKSRPVNQISEDEILKSQNIQIDGMYVRKHNKPISGNRYLYDSACLLFRRRPQYKEKKNLYACYFWIILQIRIMRFERDYAFIDG